MTRSKLMRVEFAKIFFGVREIFEWKGFNWVQLDLVEKLVFSLSFYFPFFVIGRLKKF